MAVIGPRTPADWQKAEGEGVHYTLEGGLELLRDCLVSNQYFQDIDESSDADGFPFDLPPQASSPTGFHFYSTEIGKNSLRKQTGTPAGDTWDATEPWLPEGTQPIRSPKLAITGDYRPPAPIVTIVSGGKAGYEAGERTLYMTVVSRGGRHTLPSEGVTFSLTSGQGFAVEVPDDAPSDLHLGWWLTEAGEGRSSAKLQRVSVKGRDTVRFPGPYKALEGGRKLPSRNETELSAPPKIRYGKRGMIYRGPGPGILPAGDYRFAWWKVTAFGVTRASQASDLVSVPEQRSLGAPQDFYAAQAVDGRALRAGEPGNVQRHGYEAGDAIEVRGGDLPSPLTSGNTYFVVEAPVGVEADESTFFISSSPGGPPLAFGSAKSGRAFVVTMLPYRDNEAWRVRIPYKAGRDKDVIGWVLGVQHNGQWYKLVRKGRLTPASSHFGFARPQVVRVDGDFSEAPEGAEGQRQSRAFTYVQEEPPTENTSGIEAPGSAPEAPETFQASTSLAATGKKKYVYCEVYEDGRGGERYSLPSTSVEATTAPGQYARVIAPDPNNIFPNAEGRERGADGVPLNASVIGTDGRYYHEDGKHVITTDGVTYAADTVSFLFYTREINSSLTYCFQGDIEAELEAGTANLTVTAYSANGAFIANAASKVLSSSGKSGLEVRVGPDGDVAWPDGAVSATMRLTLFGDTRRGIARAYNLAGHPYPMAPRKVERGEAYEAANFDPSPLTPWPRGVECAVGPAPVTSYESSASEPLDEVDFTKGAAFPPPNWSNATNIATSEIITESGVTKWRARDTTGSGDAYASMLRDFDVDSSLALRHIFEADGLPGGSDNYLTYGRITADEGGGSLITIAELPTRSNGGGLHLRAYDRNRDEVSQYSGVNISVADLVDYEIIASGVGTRNGTLTLLVGLNGAERTIALQLGGIDWRGLSARRVRVGGVSETNPSTRWVIDTHRVVVTATGDAIGEAAAPPSGEVVQPPDRPPDGLGGYYAEDEDGETINQLYLLIPPYFSESRFDIRNVWREAVIPGETYTFAVRGRHTIPVGDEGTLPWFLTLYNPATGEERDIGSVCGPNGCSGREPWADMPLTFTAGAFDEGFSEVRAHFLNVGPGLYLYQDVTLSLGAVAKRGYGVATSGWFRVTLDSRTPYEGACFRELTDGWASVEATAELPEGTWLSASYESSNDLLAFSAFSPPEPPEARYAAIRGDLAGDGRETPYVPPEGARLITRPARTLLLRGDRSELPGGATLDGLELPSTRPRYAVDEVGGHRLATDTTEDVTWTRPFTVEVYTEQAQKELEERWHEDWAIEDPYLLDGAGALLTIRFANVIELIQEDVPRDYVEGVRAVWARQEDVTAEVVEVLPLYGSSGGADA